MTLSLVPPIWKEAPFIRILIPFAVGIVLGNDLLVKPFLFQAILLLSVAGLLLVPLSSPFLRFKFNWVRGIIINLAFISLGCLITDHHDLKNDENSIIQQYQPSMPIKVTLEEPLVEKASSYKAVASVDEIRKKGSIVHASGKVILYFPKDSNFRKLGYGFSLLFSKSLQPIRSSGNPGSFDYKTYCERQGIFYSVFLSSNDFTIVPEKNGFFLQKFLFEIRESVINNLSIYVQGPKESGLAKALLVGYKDELDRQLVQAYSNTGVVHIIAISGLHLGIIFWLLSSLLQPLQKAKHTKWIAAIIIIAALWIFSLLTGGGPSVLRSAFMFSFIVIGKTMSKSTYIYNNLAFSAFTLLCINPYWLWDAGFQLSYLAVLSIVIFFRPIYNRLYFQNKIVDFAWKLNAVTLAAQVLTLPIAIYHFHQLPIHFLLSNLVAVPLSSLILLGEIALCCLSFLPQVAMGIGLGIQWSIQMLNRYIENVNALPFSVWPHLQISLSQVLLLFGGIIGLSWWSMQKDKRGLFVALFSLLLFAGIRSNSFYQADRQQRLIVYNVPNSMAVDIISGRNCISVKDSAMVKGEIPERLYLEPSRIVHRTREMQRYRNLLFSGNYFKLGGTTILILDHRIATTTTTSAFADVIILSKNPRINLAELVGNLGSKVVVAAATNHWRNLKKWKKDCDSLGITFHDVRSQGAYVTDLR